MNKFIALLYTTIYDNMFATDNLSTLITKYNNVINRVINTSGYTSIIGTMKALAYAIICVLFLLDLGEKATEKGFSTEQLFKAMLRYFVSAMVVWQSDTIVFYLLNATEALSSQISTAGAGAEAFSASEKTMLANGIRDMDISDQFSYILPAIIPWAIAQISRLMLYFVLISRTIEITVRMMFAPAAISDIYKNGTASNGVTYMKKIFALGIQVVVIVLINAAMQNVILALAKNGEVSSSSVKAFLVANEPVKDASGAPIYRYTVDSVKNFMTAIVYGGGGNNWQTLGIMLARVGIIYSSLPLCEEAVGVR